MISNLQAFTIEEAGTIPEEKLTAMTIYEGYLITGEEKGTITLHTIGSEKKKLVLSQQYCTKEKKAIEQLLCSPSDNIIYALSKGILYVLSIPKLEIITIYSKETISKIAVNQHANSTSYVLLITKKKKLKMGYVDITSKAFIEHSFSYGNKKEIGLDIDPDVYDWYDEYLCYVHGNKIIWVNVNSGATQTQDIPKAKNVKYIENVQGWLIYTPDMALFIELNGSSVMSISSLTFEPDIISYFGFKNYVVGLHNNQIEIRGKGITDYWNDTQFLSLKQSDGEKFTAKYMLKSSNKIIVSSVNPMNKYKFWIMEEVSYDTQIGLLLSSDKLEDATIKFNENVMSLDDKKPEKIEQFFIECAWSQLLKERFDIAFKYAHLTRFNPFEFIYLFSNLLDSKIIHDKNEVMKQIDKNSSLIEKFKRTENDCKKTYRFIINLLQKKRDYILKLFPFSDQANQNKEMEFVSTRRGLIDLSKCPMPLNAKTVFYHVNIALLKALIKIQEEDPKKIAAIIDHPHFNTKDASLPTFDFADEIFETNDAKPIVGGAREIQVTRAYLYQKQKKYGDALQIWEKKFGHATNKTFTPEARDRTKKILLLLNESKDKREENKALLLKYIKWLLTDTSGNEEGFEVASMTELISIEEFLSIEIPKIESEYMFDKDKEKDKPLNLKERFLEYLNKKNPSERYQTMLLETYIDNIIKDMPKLTKPKPLSEEDRTKFNAEKKKFFDNSLAYKHLNSIINKEASVYNKITILNKVKDTELFDIELFLNSALNYHNAALNRILKNDTADDLKTFEKLEHYCHDNITKKPDLYSDLFHILAEEYKIMTRKIAEAKNFDDFKGDIRKPEDLKLLKELKDTMPLQEKKMQNLKDEMLKIIVNYGDFDKLDPVFVLSKIPDDWNATGDNLKVYIDSVLKNYTHLVNKYKNGKSLSEMALLYKEKEALDAKNKHITIDNDTICEYCQKKIGTTMFVVYPNMKIYHTKCSVSTTICPTTGVDFTKKKILN